MGNTSALLVLWLLISVVNAREHVISKRVLPTDEACDPNTGTCRKGDWIATHIADCKYERSLFSFISCNAQNDRLGSWVVDVAQDDRCKPVDGKRFTCGASGTNTRCVCSDSNIHRIVTARQIFNECRCQYWPLQDIGANSPAFCTGYYTGGTSGVHHWACCDNCNDADSSCSGRTWQGGSSISYCGNCGQQNAAAGGRVKYPFNCGSCSKQIECERQCSSGVRSFPGLCWSWLDCFKGCCLGSTSESTFCGDGSCSGSETPTSCPVDCCYQVNDMCPSGSAQCAPLCCQAPTCCGKRYVNSGRACSVK